MTEPAHQHPLRAILVPGASWRVHVWMAIAVPLLVLAVFGAVLGGPADRVLSDLSTDTARQFLSWRSYGFGELLKGRFPLWNPYVYCGTPYFAGFQSALLYPVNWVHLVLSSPRAVNVEILINLTILGLGMYGWLMRGGHSPAVCLCGAASATLGGSVSPHVYAGHLTNLAALAWVPTVLLCLDGAWEAPPGHPRHLFCGERWVAAGAAAVALQVLAGHPQYVYYTAVCAAVYLAARALTPGTGGHAAYRGRRCLRAAGLLVATYAAGALAAAVQLVPGLLAAGENLRSGRLPYGYAALFSFPPENLLTFLVPYGFGDATTLTYWGRWYLWEMCAFAGSAALPLAAWNLLSHRRSLTALPDAITAALLLLLAFGAYTPLYPLLYHGLPGFGSFRCPAKFVFFAGLFMLRLAATGLDRLLTAASPPRRLVQGLGLLAGVCGGFAAWTRLAALTPASLAGSLWARVLGYVQASGQTCLPAEAVADPQWLAATATGAASSALRTVSFLLGLLMAIGLKRRHPPAALALPALVLLEMVLFASNFRVTFSVHDLGLEEIEAVVRDLTPGQRLLHLPSHNLPMLAGTPDIWGNDPSLSRRYAEFMALAQGHGPAAVTQDMSVGRLHPLLRLTGCRYAFLPGRLGVRVTALSPPPLPRLHLVSNWSVLSRRGDIFRRLADPAFDPVREVILESDPGLVRGDGPGAGTVQVMDEDSDHLHVQVDCSADAVLLISQAYSRWWSAVPAQRTDHRAYRLLPANYAFQAVPLPAGSHDLRIAYAAPGLRLGTLLSFIGAGGLVLALGHRRARSAE